MEGIGESILKFSKEIGEIYIYIYIIHIKYKHILSDLFQEVGLSHCGN